MAWCPARTHRTWLQAARLPTFRFRQRFDLTVQSVQSVLSVLSLESSLCSLCSLNVICQYMSYVCFKDLHQAFYCRLSLALWIFVDLCGSLSCCRPKVDEREAEMDRRCLHPGGGYCGVVEMTWNDWRKQKEKLETIGNIFKHSSNGALPAGGESTVVRCCHSTNGWFQMFQYVSKRVLTHFKITCRNIRNSCTVEVPHRAALRPRAPAHPRLLSRPEIPLASRHHVVCTCCTLFTL